MQCAPLDQQIFSCSLALEKYGRKNFDPNFVCCTFKHGNATVSTYKKIDVIIHSLKYSPRNISYYLYRVKTDFLLVNRKRPEKDANLGSLTQDSTKTLGLDLPLRTSIARSQEDAWEWVLARQSEALEMLLEGSDLRLEELFAQISPSDLNVLTFQIDHFDLTDLIVVMSLLPILALAGFSLVEFLNDANFSFESRK